MKRQNLILIPVITALLIVFVLITPPISIGVIPFSLQPLFIAIIALLFDWKTSLYIITLYILIGFLGLPVFSGGKNGIATIASGTVGFIWGFLPFTLFLSLSNFKNTNNSITSQFLRFFIVPFFAIFSLYLCGFLSMHCILHWSIKHFSITMSSFFIIDVIKLIIAFLLVSFLKPTLKRFM